jgi:hypothetical protein
MSGRVFSKEEAKAGHRAQGKEKRTWSVKQRALNKKGKVKILMKPLMRNKGLFLWNRN